MQNRLVAAGAAYRPRIVEDEFALLLSALPAIVILGARGVGKTSTALRLASTVRKLDDPAQLALIRAGTDVTLAGERPVLIDEWQRAPEVWDAVRRAVDADRTAGQFILTGSADPGPTPMHSGAGRMVTLHMRPLSLAERGLGPATVRLSELLEGGQTAVRGRTDVTVQTYTQEIVASGFPGWRGLPARPLRAQIDGYIQLVIEREFPEMGRLVRRPATLLRWMRAYAAATSTTASYETIRKAATSDAAEKPSKATTKPYTDILERLWLLDPVEAWVPGHSLVKGLSSPPKHHLVDPALATRLLGLSAEALLAGTAPRPAIPREGSFLGALFESLVTQSVRVYAQAAEADVRHMRTFRGEHEVDLIIVRDDGRILAVEVKLTRAVNDDDGRHLRWLRDRIGDRLIDAVIVTTGPEAYRRPDGIAVVPAALLGP